MNTSYRKEDRSSFRRLATKRTQQALRQIRLIGNLSNRSNYAYEEKDVRKIFAALRQEMKETEILFQRSKDKKFKLEE